ncbi:MAG: creatininase family protein [Chloroflexota bacterium]
MKRPTVFLGEMTDPEVVAYLADGSRTVLVPTGSTEQHGPHGPLLTDMLVAQEVARRVAPRIGAVVAPPINYALSYPHVGFAVVHIRVATFMALIEDLCVSFGDIGFERIVFLNGHYDNTYAIAYACASAAERIRAGVRAFPVNYWDGMTVAEREAYFDQAAGLHANAAETSAVLAIDPGLVDMERANAEFPPFPETSNPGPVHTAFFFSAPGSVHRASRSGTWGDARGATAEIGERYLEVGVESTLRILDDIEKTFAAMPAR